MADSTKMLESEINLILEGADLTVMSSKKVRLQLEKKLKCKLLDRKQEIDDIVMKFVNNQKIKEEASGSESSESEPEPEPEPEQKKKISRKRPAEEEETNDSDIEPEVKYGRRRAAKKEKKVRGEGKGGGGNRGKNSGYLKSLTLSPALANLMGAESLPRYEVVKKVWAIIKERNLYDPKNKQYAICDGDLIKVIGVKRFRTFGMLKYLKSHFIE